MSMPGHPNREIYNEFQRVAVTNRFIFTQAAIIVGVSIVFGPSGAVAYELAWGAILMLALGFERPYRLLRALWPRGNWPPQVTLLPTRWKVRSLVGAIFLLLFFGAVLWISYSVTFPWLSNYGGGPPADTCMGLVCLLLHR